jgi:hypothetical protein
VAVSEVLPSEVRAASCALSASCIPSPAIYHITQICHNDEQLFIMRVAKGVKFMTLLTLMTLTGCGGFVTLKVLRKISAHDVLTLG